MAKQSRTVRWADACARAMAALEELVDLQSEYSNWMDNLPENLQSSPVGDKLSAICDLNLQDALDTVNDAEGMDLPLGFGRD